MVGYDGSLMMGYDPAPAGNPGFSLVPRPLAPLGGHHRVPHPWGVISADPQPLGRPGARLPPTLIFRFSTFFGNLKNSYPVPPHVPRTLKIEFSVKFCIGWYHFHPKRIDFGKIMFFDFCWVDNHRPSGRQKQDTLVAGLHLHHLTMECPDSPSLGLHSCRSSASGSAWGSSSANFYVSVSNVFLQTFTFTLTDMMNCRVGSGYDGI